VANYGRVASEFLEAYGDLPGHERVASAFLEAYGGLSGHERVASVFMEAYGDIPIAGRVYALFVEVSVNAQDEVGMVLLSDHVRFHSGGLLGYSANVHAGRATRRN
jgi:hypothetical protein